MFGMEEDALELKLTLEMSSARTRFQSKMGDLVAGCSSCLHFGCLDKP